MADGAGTKFVSDGGTVVAVDASIYNRAALLRILDLQEPGPDDRGLLAAAYEKWGVRMFDWIEGDYAFALWDPRRQALLCGRDPFGVRQLVYRVAEHRFAVATEIGALLEIAGGSRRLNEQRVADYLLLELDDFAATLYEGVKRLPPAHYAFVTANQLTVERYWSPKEVAREGFVDPEEGIVEYRKRFVNSVSRRIPGAGQAATLLSGGLDSSSISCVAAEVLQRRGAGRLLTLSGRYPGKTCDEGDYIDAVAERWGTDSRSVKPDRVGALDEIAEDIAPGEPLWTPQISLLRSLYAHAAQLGVRVLLDGFGGDFVVSHGPAHLTDLVRRGRLLAAYREGRGLRENFGYSRSVVLRQWVVAPLVPRAARQMWRAMEHRNEPWWANGMPFDDSFSRRVGVAERSVELKRDRVRRPRSALEWHLRQLDMGWVPLALDVADRAAARAGLEPRYPFFDRQLVELCVRLPPSLKVQQGLTRIVVRRAMDGYLPPAVQWRRGKADLTPGFNASLLPIVQTEAYERVLGAGSPLRGILRLERLRSMRDAYIATGNTGVGSVVWRAFVVARWMDRALAAGVAMPPSLA